MTVPPHIQAELRHEAVKAEELGRLTDKQLSVIYNNRWFKLFVPKEFGGLALSIPEGVRLEEELARIDGSLGWTVTLCAGANLFAGFLPPAVAQTLFGDQKICFGGSGQAAGHAEAEAGGYRITGKWRYATGAPHLTHFTANCVIEREGKPLLDEQGNTLVKSFFMPKAGVRVVEDWNTFGLKATASHSFDVDGVWVADTHSFVIRPEYAEFPDPVYRYPFLQFAEVTLAVNTLGMARHFMECFVALTEGKLQNSHSEKIRGLFQIAGTRLKQSKRLFYDALEASWDGLLQYGTIPQEQLTAVSHASRSLVEVARQQVVLLYPYSGIEGAAVTSEINRSLRDIFTASQHSLFR
ncbi:Acyl-CoA dehydrogenase [Parapedobacter composti]|uniref:Acyl-CoA dehydrogenase n=1 Tax=Parapedobacter composti TaxID=623281 RepID=A0A1I1JK64_9SPHI|nr:hypothetical protein [Parapedobacter composti]SFC48947.1 Acyl-CoA dehydrogenase [Parapedobacter composti]